MATQYDYIIVGLGSMGSAALYHLSKRSQSVLGLEQFESPHEYGSHGGQSRIIRMAYYEHPNYIPLLQRAYQNWDLLQKESGTKIFYRTGLYYAGPVDNAIIKNVKSTAAEYRIALGNYSHPKISIPEVWESFIEADAGFLKPELAVKIHLQQAQKNGATLLQRTKVNQWTKDGNRIKVETDKGDFYCKKIVFTAGPWTSSLIHGIEKKLTITRQILAWIKVPEKKLFEPEHFPCWFIMDENKPGAYYGFPWLDKDLYNENQGLKLAYHYPGEITDPDHVDRSIKANDLEGIKEVVRTYFKIEPEIMSAKVCLYSNTPDEHFVIDNMPGMEDHVCFAWGFSGHGFKFVSVVGEILADLAVNSKTTLPIDFLNARRFED